MIKQTENGFIVDSRFVPDDPANRDYQEVQEWIRAGNIPEPEFTPAEALQKAKQEKIEELKREGLARIQAVLPGVKDWDSLELERERWLSTAPMARSPTPSYQAVIDIYQKGSSVASGIKLLQTLEEVTSYDIASAFNN